MQEGEWKGAPGELFNRFRKTLLIEATVTGNRKGSPGMAEEVLQAPEQRDLGSDVKSYPLLTELPWK